MIGLVVLLCIVAALYLFRDRVKHEWRAVRGLRDTPEVATPELGTIAADKIEGLRAGKTGRVALGATELQSLLQYKYAGLLPAFAQDPHVELEGDHIRLRVRVPVDRLPDVKGLESASAFLPDTADVEVSGTLIPLQNGRTALGVDAVEASHIPLPARMINEGLRRVGRKDEAGLPKDAIAVKLPDGVKAAYIRNDSLILLARAGN
jgi:hypothetical protein